MMSLTDYTIAGMADLLNERYGKGEFHAKGLFSYLHNNGQAGLDDLEKAPAFKDNPNLAERIKRDLPLNPPRLIKETSHEGTVKALLEYSDGNRCESVFIPMETHNTLCISSQFGCARGCTFCQTARMGLIRNLMAGEILDQVRHHHFEKGRKIRNIVFMGMGEPLDNFDNVLRAVDILSDPRGLFVRKRFISLSTCGQVEGLDRLARLIDEKPQNQYAALRIAVSLNNGDDDKRSAAMPVNRIWPLNVLKESLMRLPQSREKDRLYFEYVLMEGVNDSREDAQKLLGFMDGLGGKVNLIPLHSSNKALVPSAESLDRFWRWIREGGREIRTRKSKGLDILAACGQLASEPSDIRES